MKLSKTRLVNPFISSGLEYLFYYDNVLNRLGRVPLVVELYAE